VSQIVYNHPYDAYFMKTSCCKHHANSG